MAKREFIDGVMDTSNVNPAASPPQDKSTSQLTSASAEGRLVVPTGRAGMVPYPRSLAFAPLFSIAKRGTETGLATLDEVDVQLAVSAKIRVRRWGVGLTAEHQDVLLALFKKCAGLEANLDAEKNKEHRFYVEIRCSAKELLDTLGKSYSPSNRDWLRRRLSELSRSHLTVYSTESPSSDWPLFQGCLLQLRSRAKPTQGVLCHVSIPVEFMLLFRHLGYGQIDLEQRKRLGSSQLARLLQTLIECLKDRKSNTHYSYSVAKWMELTGTKASETNFTPDLKKALARLKRAGFLQDFSVSRGKVHLDLCAFNDRKRDSSELDEASAPKPPAGVSTTRRQRSLQRRYIFPAKVDGRPLELGKEVPAIAEILGTGDWADPLEVSVYADVQLVAMLNLFPKAYKEHPDLESVLVRLRSELQRRDNATDGSSK